MEKQWDLIKEMLTCVQLDLKIAMCSHPHHFRIRMTIAFNLPLYHHCILGCVMSLRGIQIETSNILEIIYQKPFV